MFIKIILWAVGLFIALFFIVAVTRPSQAEREANRQENVEYCKKLNKVYIQKDLSDKGECMDFQEATKAIINIQKDLENRGIK